MRIVQLLEGDYNAGLRYLVQCMGVAYAESNGLYSGSTYGGRKGKHTHTRYWGEYNQQMNTVD